MPDSPSQSAPDTMPAGKPAVSTEIDPLAGLYHMSNTAGVSTQEYMAINLTAFWSLVFGLLSVLVLFHDLFLVLPLVGVVCAVVAIIQIRNSNQTQTGKGLAIAGLVLSVLLGGGKAGYEIVNGLRITADERVIAQLTHELGQDLAAKNYEKAYQRFDATFRERVSAAKFDQTLKMYNEVPQLGALRSVEWNQHRIELEEKPDSGIMYAYAMVLFQYAGNPDPRRLVLTFEKSGGQWHLHDMPSFFSTKAQQ